MFSSWVLLIHCYWKSQINSLYLSWLILVACSVWDLVSPSLLDQLKPIGKHWCRISWTHWSTFLPDCPTGWVFSSQVLLIIVTRIYCQTIFKKLISTDLESIFCVSFESISLSPSIDIHRHALLRNTLWSNFLLDLPKQMDAAASPACWLFMEFRDNFLKPNLTDPGKHLPCEILGVHSLSPIEIHWQALLPNTLYIIEQFSSLIATEMRLLQVVLLV